MLDFHPPGAVWDEETGWHFPDGKRAARVNETDFPIARGLRISREALAAIVREELLKLVPMIDDRRGASAPIVELAVAAIVQRAYAQPGHDDQHRIDGGG
jgi:hypothetical protein